MRITMIFLNIFLCACFLLTWIRAREAEAKQILYWFKDRRLYTLIGWTLDDQTLFEDAGRIYKWHEKIIASYGSTFQAHKGEKEGEVIFKRVETINS